MESSQAEEKLIDLLVRDLAVAPELIRPGARLEEDLGLDSLGMVDLLLGMEEAFGVSIPDEMAEQITTVESAVEALVRLTAGPGRR